MGFFVTGRLVQAIVSMFIVSVMVFGIVRLSGDPLQMLLPDEAPPEQYESLKKQLHLDRPIYIQYWNWVSGVLVGDLGVSNTTRVPVSELLAERLPATIQLALVAFAITLALALPIGVYAAAYRGSLLDKFARGFAVLGQAQPSFWTAILSILVFAVYLGWLPPGGRDGWKSVILPAVTLGWLPVAGLMRLTRSSMIQVLNSEYVKLARIKGVSEVQVLWKHALKNAALTVLTFSGLLFVGLITGSVITETVFSWPGVGRLVIDAVNDRDFPVIQGVVLIFSAWYIFMNLVVDVAYAYLNPKIRY